MSEETEGKRYVFEFSGDFVELVVAPIPRDKAEHWLTRNKEDLLVHAYNSEDQDEYVELDNIEATFLSGAKTVEGCELKNGSLGIYDPDGNEVGALSLESDEVDIDDIQQIDLDTYVVDGGPTLIRRTCFTGDVTYRPEIAVESLEEAHWYVFITDTGTEPFISAFHFGDDESDEEVPPDAGGRCNRQEVWLRVPDADGNVREAYHSISPE